ERARDGGAPPGPPLAPRPPAVKLGEAGDERQPDADAGGRARGTGALPEGFEDRGLELGRDAAALVLDDDQDPVLAPIHPCPDAAVRRGMPGGVGQQVLDDPLDLRGVDVRDELFGPALDLAPAELFELAYRVADERADGDPPALRRDDPALQSVEIEQVAQQPLELAGVRRDALEQVD